ncbi:MAG: phage major capsid protein [Gemmobacter sp.]
MLDSVKIARRQSEIRQALAGLVGRDAPTDDEARQMEALDNEYRINEVRYRAALVAEDTERREAGLELETRAGRQWADLLAAFELRQVALALDEGRALTGQTAEVVAELRSRGGFRGVPVPLAALEQRNTVAAGTPDPIRTMPTIDRLFPDSVASRMGAAMISVDNGAMEYPVVTSNVTAGWADGEGANVAGPTAYVTTDRALRPDHTLGVQLRISRKALRQSGDALEGAIRRDIAGTMAAELDKAIFRGTGANGQPLGVIAGAATYGIEVLPFLEWPDWGAFRRGIVRFMAQNAASSPAAVRVLIRPETWDELEGSVFSSTAVTQYDRMTANIGAQNIVMSANALAAPGGDPVTVSALLSTGAGGVPPMFVGMWGALDLIRDPFSDAQSGGLRITALATMDVTVARPAQMRVLTFTRIA